MEIKKYSYERSASRTAFIVLTVLSVLCAVSATVMALLQITQLSIWATVLLYVFMIFLSVATLVLAMLVVFAEPRLITAASILTAILQTAVLALCLCVAANGALFNYFPKALVIPSVLVAILIFVGVWVAFIVMRHKASNNPNRKKGFRAVAIVLTAIVCLLFGVEIVSAVLGQNKILKIMEFEGKVTDPYQQFKADGYDYSDNNIQTRFWHSDEYYTTEYGNEQIECMDVFDVSNSVNIAEITGTYPTDYVDAGNKAITYFRQKGLLSASENPEILNSYYINISDVQAHDKYILVNDSWNGYYTSLAIKLKTYKTEIKTALEVFNDEFPGINLDTSKSLTVYNDPDYPNSDLSLRVGRIRSVFRFPNVFVGVMMLLGVIALWVLTLKCNVVETVIKVKTFETRSDLKSIAYQNVALNLFLTLITLGIYGFVWFYRNAQNVRRIIGDESGGCGDEVLLYIVGGPFYTAYWYHTRLKRLHADVNGFDCSKYFWSPTRYLLISLFAGRLFALSVLATQFNKLAEDTSLEASDLPTSDDNSIATLSNRRSLVKTFLLGLVTLGIYWIVTQVIIANRVKIIQGKPAASTSQLVCMMLVPFYWIFWLVKNRGLYNEGSNEATLQTWLMLVMPMYSAYWLISRADELCVGASALGTEIENEPIWSTLLAVFVPMLAFALMLFKLNNVADSIVKVSN